MFFFFRTRLTFDNFIVLLVQLNRCSGQSLVALCPQRRLRVAAPPAERGSPRESAAALDVNDSDLLLGNVDARREADVTGDARKVLRRFERTGNGLLLGRSVLDRRG